MKQSDYARSAARWAGVVLEDEQLGVLERYAAWLVEEAIPAGGLGPREGPTVWPRHIADSLTFAVGLPQTGIVADIGTGVGLPGIPLAIARPDLQFWLVDRGGRRTRLVERALSLLGLEDVVVMRRDVADLSGRFEGMVFRGALQPKAIPVAADRLLAPGGSVTVGYSRREAPPPIDEVVAAAHAVHFDVDLVEVPPDVLDGPAWLLKMARSGS